MDKGKQSVFQKWLWEREPLRVFVWAFIFIPSALALALYPFLGAEALFILSFASIGLLAWIVYGVVGRRVGAVRASLSSEEGEPVDSLIVNGIIQSPGIALLKEDELLLIPIVGRRVAVSLAEIKSARETTWYNGSLLFFKRGFWLEIPGRNRLGVAVPSSSAGLFRRRLGLTSRADAHGAV